MKQLIMSLKEKVTQIEKGQSEIIDLDQALCQAQELIEKLYILRYKAYELKILPTKEQGQEIHTTFDFSETINKEDAVLSLDLSTDEPKIEENPSIESIEVEEVSIFESEIENEELEKEEIPLETLANELALNETEPLEEKSLFDGLEDKKKEPLDISSLLAQNKNKQEKLDTLIGSFSLKEKLQYINQLFNGSSESFANAIKNLDESGSLDQAEKHLVFLSSEYEWVNAEHEVILKIIQKVCARHEKT